MYYTTSASAHIAIFSLQSSAREDFWTWLFFTIALGLFPLVLGALFLLVFIASKISPKNYLDLLKDGELFFFATTLSANSLNKLMVLPPLVATTTASAAPNPGGIQAGLWTVLLLSLGGFAACILSKLNELAQSTSGGSGGGQRIVRVGGVAIVSIICAAIACYLSYNVYTYGGA
jgi:hypothetical protein